MLWPLRLTSSVITWVGIMDRSDVPYSEAVADTGFEDSLGEITLLYSLACGYDVCLLLSIVAAEAAQATACGAWAVSPPLLGGTWGSPEGPGMPSWELRTCTFRGSGVPLWRSAPNDASWDVLSFRAMCCP
jgi:hypothetical protein